MLGKSEVRFSSSGPTARALPVNTVADYLRHAEECDALAAKAASPEQRAMIADMAETWRMLARQRETWLVKKAAEPDAAD